MGKKFAGKKSGTVNAYLGPSAKGLDAGTALAGKKLNPEQKAEAELKKLRAERKKRNKAAAKARKRNR